MQPDLVCTQRRRSGGTGDMEPGGRHLGQLGRMLQADTRDASVATTITIGIDYMHNQNATRTQTYKIGIARDSVGGLDCQHIL